ncbi:MAG: 3'(2'),5'-bisphosphate nucleotidase CysQ [Dehalococcoidia bacterium]|nr:3'(2'),5'-bisphosphate nucleotidase CysQ [Dehalococcoidia bacterium]
MGERESLAAALCALAEDAGREILDVYAGDIEVRDKADTSPVTDADERAERIILAGLQRLAPGVAVVAEEQVAAGGAPEVGEGPFILVDPLDGTREFVNRNGEFTVNIALIEGGEPVLGVVHLPALDETYWAAGPGAAYRRRGEGAPERIACRTPSTEGLVVVASRSHRDEATDEFLRDYQVKELVSAGSSLKLCRVAEGSADLYPRIGRTMEWDIAAGHAVLGAAGGSVSRLDGTPLTYGKPGFENPHFVARGLPASGTIGA